MQLSTHSRVFIGKTKILYSLSNSQPSSPSVPHDQHFTGDLEESHGPSISHERPESEHLPCSDWLLSCALGKANALPWLPQGFRACPCCSTRQTFLAKTEECVTVRVYQFIYLLTCQEHLGCFAFGLLWILLLLKWADKYFFDTRLSYT